MLETYNAVIEYAISIYRAYMPWIYMTEHTAEQKFFLKGLEYFPTLRGLIDVLDMKGSEMSYGDFQHKAELIKRGLDVLIASKQEAQQ